MSDAGPPRLLLPAREAELLRRLQRELAGRFAPARGGSFGRALEIAMRLVVAVVFLLMISGIALFCGLYILVRISPRTMTFSAGQFACFWVVATAILLAVAWVQRSRDRGSLDDRDPETGFSSSGRQPLAGYGGGDPRLVAGAAGLGCAVALGGAVFDIFESIFWPRADEAGPSPLVCAAALLVAGREGLPEDYPRWATQLGRVLEPAPGRRQLEEAGKALVMGGLLRVGQRIDGAGRHYVETMPADAGRRLLLRFQLVVPSPAAQPPQGAAGSWG